MSFVYLSILFMRVRFVGQVTKIHTRSIIAKLWVSVKLLVKMFFFHLVIIMIMEWNEIYYTLIPSEFNFNITQDSLQLYNIPINSLLYLRSKFGSFLILPISIIPYQFHPRFNIFFSPIKEPCSLPDLHLFPWSFPVFPVFPVFLLYFPNFFCSIQILPCSSSSFPDVIRLNLILMLHWLRFFLMVKMWKLSKVVAVLLPMVRMEVMARPQLFSFIIDIAY